MAKGKSKSTIAPNVKAAVCTAALLASGASAKGLRQSQSRASDKEGVVASFHLSSKQDLNDDPPHSNLKVTEKVIAETAPFQMIRQKRSMEVTGEQADSDSDSEQKKKKSKKKKKKKKKKDPNAPKRTQTQEDLTRKR